MKGKSLTLIGTAITLAFTSNVAMAQSSESLMAESSDSSMGTAAEIKMSPEGMKILCQRFPLNSRCPGGIPLDRNFLSPVSSPETSPETNPDTNSIDSNTTVDTTTAPSIPITPSPDNSSQLTPVPENSPTTEFSTPEQAPVNILPQTAPSGT